MYSTGRKKIVIQNIIFPKSENGIRSASRKNQTEKG